MSPNKIPLQLINYLDLGICFMHAAFKFSPFLLLTSFSKKRSTINNMIISWSLLILSAYLKGPGARWSFSCSLHMTTNDKWEAKGDWGGHALSLHREWPDMTWKLQPPLELIVHVSASKKKWFCFFFSLMMIFGILMMNFYVWLLITMCGPSSNKRCFV